MWSPVEKTALAEAEVEYHDKESFTIWVKFKVVNDEDKELNGSQVVIWTTTPGPFHQIKQSFLVLN